MAVAVSIRIFNTRFSVTFPFCAIVTLMLYIDKTGFMSISLAAVLVHEAGHFIAMRILKIKPREISLSLRGVLIVSPGVATDVGRLIVAGAGPAANIITGVVSFALGFNTVGYVHFIVAVYNLLMIKGLDGGEIVSALMNICGYGEKRWIPLIVSYVSIGFLITAGTSILLFYGNVSLILLGIYLLFLNLLALL